MSVMVQDVDLYYRGQRDPIGPEGGGPEIRLCIDPLRYIVWIKPRPNLFPDELAPRMALHVNHAWVELRQSSITYEKSRRRRP